MVKIATLGKIAVGLVFPMYGFLYFTQSRISKKFAQQSYYSEAIQLLKGYKPIIDKIGEPISAGFIDVSDDFNYHEEKNEKIARAKIPIKGTNTSANLLVYASLTDNKKWKIDYLEIESKTGKFKFYDGALLKKSE